MDVDKRPEMLYLASMKIALDQIDTNFFMVHQHVVNGEVLHLVQPQHIACPWSVQNKIFRSSVWNNDGELVSAGFCKFPNLHEKPDVFPVPTNLKNAVVTSKLDGSLLIVSKYKGQFILRTRGTVNAIVLENGYELTTFIEKFLPKLKSACSGEDTWPTSFLFEWLTASADHTIVLKYDNVPDWILIGAVHHEDYSLFRQSELDVLASACGFKRPEKHTFNSVDELVDIVTGWKNQEGVVLYTNDGQSLHKVKSDDYKKKHAFKSNATLENTIELFFAFDKPDFNAFKQKIGELYDWECVQMVIGFMSNICDAWKDVQKIVAGMQKFVEETLKPLPTRRAQAEKVIASYGPTNRAAFVFKILDGKGLVADDRKKLLYQVLKK